MKVLNLKKIVFIYVLILIIPFSLFYFIFSDDKHNASNASGVAPSFSMWWWLFSAFFTAGLGYWFQYRLAKNKLKLDRLEKRATFLKQIAKEFNELVSFRIYMSKIYCQGLLNRDLSDFTRDNYKKCIMEWNNKIHSIYGSLSMNGIVSLSNQIEIDIHNRFLSIHEKYAYYVKHKNYFEYSEYEKIIKTINEISSLSISYANYISDLSELSWNEPLDKLDPLTPDNIGQASNFTLIKRIFNPNSKVLGVKRPLNK